MIMRTYLIYYFSLGSANRDDKKKKTSEKCDDDASLTT